MPYKSGLIQAAVGAVCTIAFVISQQFGSPEPRLKRLVGILQKTGASSFVLIEPNARQHQFELSTPVSIHLNEREISFTNIENGRTVAVDYTGTKGRLKATAIDVFPNHTDFDSSPEDFAS